MPDFFSTLTSLLEWVCNRVHPLICAQADRVSQALFAVFYFVDIYFAFVQNYPPGKAGTQLLYYTPGLGGKFHL
jgi:hypothetical protein